MAVRVRCPHCQTPCQVAEQHLGKPVQCGRCTRTFTTRTGTTALVLGPVRLDVVATSGSLVGQARKRAACGYVQHLAWSNLDERHELALLAMAVGPASRAGPAGDRVIRTAGAVLAPLLSGALAGRCPDAVTARVPETIAHALREANRAVRNDPACKGMTATAAIVVIWDGQALIGQAGACRVHHQRAGRLTPVTRDPATNAIGEAADLEPAACPLRLAAGDWLLLAGDSLHAHLDAPALQDEIAKAPPSAADLAQRLVERVGERGAAIAVRCW